MKQIVDKLNKIAKKINENVELSDRDLIIDSLDSITKAYGGTPNDSTLIVDKLDDIYDNISPAVSGNIEITENGENINVAPYATATVNVPGDGADLIDELRKLTYNRYHLFEKPVALNSWLDNVVIYESNDKANYRYYIDVEALKNTGVNTVYVDKASAGSDSGTQSNPYKTIKKAFQNTSNGDTIMVAKGIYYKGELPPTTSYNKNHLL